MAAKSSARASAAAASGAVARLRKEYAKMIREPVDGIEAVPREENLLEWHYVIIGPRDSPYEGGQYWGRLVFPKEYPYKPPAVYMNTPNGRFQINNTRLCMSMSDFHPETWNPLWSVSSIVSGVRSFLVENEPTYGSMVASDSQRRQLARDSYAWNQKNTIFSSLFPHLMDRVWTDPSAAPAPTAGTDNKNSAAAIASAAAAGSATASTTGSGGGSGGGALGPDMKVVGDTSSTGSGSGGGGATKTNQNQQLRPEEKYDRLILIVLIITLIFGLSFLYR